MVPGGLVAAVGRSRWPGRWDGGATRITVVRHLELDCRAPGCDEVGALPDWRPAGVTDEIPAVLREVDESGGADLVAFPSDGEKTPQFERKREISGNRGKVHQLGENDVSSLIGEEYNNWKLHPKDTTDQNPQDNTKRLSSPAQKKRGTAEHLK